MRVLPSVLGSGRGQGQKYALPVLSVKGGQGEAESYSKSGAKEAKGGEEMRHKRKSKLIVIEFGEAYKGGRWRNVLRARKAAKK